MYLFGSIAIVEMVKNGISIHQLKKLSGTETLKQYFKFKYYAKKLPTKDLTLDHELNIPYYQAVKNFIKSLAAYSIVSYILQLKDRHNGNILIDHKGHLIHIDYGFFLSSSPKNLNFEQAPFKLSPEFCELLMDESSDNWNLKDSKNYQLFKKYMVQGFLAIKKHQDRLLDIVQIMIKSPFLQFNYSYKVQEGMLDINDLPAFNPETKNNSSRNSSKDSLDHLPKLPIGSIGHDLSHKLRLLSASQDKHHSSKEKVFKSHSNAHSTAHPEDNPFIYYENPTEIYDSFKYRLHVNLTEEKLEQQVEKLIDMSRSAWTTPLYDKFQYWTNGIL